MDTERVDRSQAHVREGALRAEATGMEEEIVFDRIDHGNSSGKYRNGSSYKRSRAMLAQNGQGRSSTGSSASLKVSPRVDEHDDEEDGTAASNSLSNGVVNRKNGGSLTSVASSLSDKRKKYKIGTSFAGQGLVSHDDDDEEDEESMYSTRK